jgi:small neutral amino acid transporter SnatA (MarC family)
MTSEMNFKMYCVFRGNFSYYIFTYGKFYVAYYTIKVVGATGAMVIGVIKGLT